MSSGRSSFAVVGAGLGGSLMAVYLARAGHQVEIFERRDDPRQGGADCGRSINMAISTRGLHAMGEVGVEEKVLAQAVPMRGRMIHSPAGNTTFQPYGTDPHHVINSISRAGLNMALLGAAQAYGNVKVTFDCQCTGIDLDTATVRFRARHSGAESRAQADAVVGADGAFSVIRSRMQRLDRFNYQQFYLEHGYKELTIPAADGGGFALEKNALHIWPRGGYMMIALPNQDGSFTCTLFWPFAGPNSFAALKNANDVREFFGRNFRDALPLMPTLADDYFANPTSSLVTVRSQPWHYKDRVVLLGDACHAVVPFYGQGANAAFEDCFVLDECMQRHAAHREVAFAEYGVRRREHVDALADLALHNFIEMRDHTASRLFLAKKWLERKLHRLFPRFFVPLYSMVSFSRLPYRDAVRKASRQWSWVLGVAAALALAALGALGVLLKRLT